MGVTAFWLMKFKPEEERVIDDWWDRRLARSKAAGRYPVWKPIRRKKRWNKR